MTYINYYAFMKGEKMSLFNQKNPTYSNKSARTQNNYPGYKVPCQNQRRRRQSPPNNAQQIRDYGPYPFAVNIDSVTENNNTFRTALWTGEFLQLTLMSLLPGEDIGLERHDDVDQFVRIEEGRGLLLMGDDPDNPNFQQTVTDDYAFIIPAGKWHNLTNIGSSSLKLYSIYAPPQHPYGTVHQTKTDATEAENQ